MNGPMSPFAAFRTFRNVRCLSACRGRAENIRSMRVFSAFDPEPDIGCCAAAPAHTAT
jgi:hypothetical protein